MSELLASAARVLNAPEDMVQRSAEARAKASGTSVEEVLMAWAGGGAVTSAPAAAAAPAPAVSSAPTAESSMAAPPPAMETVQAVAAVGVAERPVIEIDPDDEVVAASVGERIRLASRIGMWTGLATSFLVMLFATQWLLPRASLAGVEGAYRAAVDVVPGWIVVGAGLLGLASGMVIGPFSRTAAGFKGKGHALVNPGGASTIAGGGAGLLVGLLVGAIVAGSGEIIEGVEGVVKVPMLGALIWTAIGWMGLGALSATVVQFFGTPAGITEEEAMEVSAVRRRLGAAFGIPIKVALTIAVVVLPVAYAFISFPKWAPLTGSFVAASILAFAGLSASRPNLRISRNEFFVAAAGVITVVVLIVSVLAAQGGGGHEETTGESGTAEESGH